MIVRVREKRIRNSLLQKLAFPHCLFDKILPIEDMETIIEIVYQNSIQYNRNARRDYEIFTLYFKDKVSIEVLMDKFNLLYRDLIYRVYYNRFPTYN